MRPEQTVRLRATTTVHVCTNPNHMQAPAGHWLDNDPFPFFCFWVLWIFRGDLLSALQVCFFGFVVARWRRGSPCASAIIASGTIGKGAGYQEKAFSPEDQRHHYDSLTLPIAATRSEWWGRTTSRVSRFKQGSSDSTFRSIFVSFMGASWRIQGEPLPAQQNDL